VYKHYEHRIEIGICFDSVWQWHHVVVDRLVTDDVDVVNTSDASDSNSPHLPTKHFILVALHTLLTSYSITKLLSPHAYPPLSRFLFHDIIYHLAHELFEFLHLKYGILYLFKLDNQSHFPHSNAI